MNWQVLANGHEANLDHPTLADIDINSISHHLSQINRFTGAAIRPYSVAEHSLLVAEIAVRELGLNVHGQLASLLHDAHEAFTNDQSTPSKRKIGEGWYQFEHTWQRLVAQRFHIITPATVFSAEIRRADLIALATEREQLLPKITPGDLPASPWPVLTGIAPVTWVDLMAPARQAATWADWRDRFADEFDLLHYRRTHMHRKVGTTAKVA